MNSLSPSLFLCHNPDVTYYMFLHYCCLKANLSGNCRFFSLPRTACTWATTYSCFHFRLHFLLQLCATHVSSTTLSTFISSIITSYAKEHQILLLTINISTYTICAVATDRWLYKGLKWETELSGHKGWISTISYFLYDDLVIWIRTVGIIL